MYYRNIKTAITKNENDVPVQYFGDSFAADAFKIKNDNKRENKSDEKAEYTSVKETDRKDSETKERLFGKDIDNLLLLGLIFLFLTDCECKEDIILPVLLGVILLS